MSEAKPTTHATMMAQAEQQIAKIAGETLRMGRALRETHQLRNLRVARIEAMVLASDQIILRGSSAIAEPPCIASCLPTSVIEMESQMGETKGRAKSAAAGSVTDQRRYFMLDVDMGLSSSPQRVWVNETKLREGFRADSKLPFRGLIFSEPPKIAFDRRKRRGPLRDADTIMLGIWLVSDRLKALFERIDPEAFVFMRAEVDYSNFEEPGPGFWFCDIVRMLDCVDEDRSKLTYYDTVYLINENNAPFRGYQALIDVKMRPEAVGLAHAFRLKYATLKQIVDDVFVEAVKTEKIKGFRFVDIQKQ